MGKKMNYHNSGFDEPKRRKLEKIIYNLLVEIGEDPSREGLNKTPKRVTLAWEHFLKGYHQTLGEIIGDAVFEEKIDEIVVMKDIDFFSLCEHHLLPFKGVVHIGYLPNRKIIGISKLARIVELYARRLQVQERMTQQIADALVKVLKPKGVGVIAEAEHLCMQMRGVEKKASYLVTSAVRGEFKRDQKTRMEFLSILDMRKK